MKDYKNKFYNPRKASKGGDPIDKHDPVQAKPLEVKVYNDNFEKALKAFRALVQKERILSTYKEKQGYEKPSVKRRRKQNENKRKQFELERSQARYAARGKPKPSEKNKNVGSS